jgi:hypothetical protein
MASEMTFIPSIALVELVQSQGSHQASVVHLINKCNLFKSDLMLTILPS